MSTDGDGRNEGWALIEQLPVGVVELDGTGRVTMANAEARRLLDGLGSALVGARLVGAGASPDGASAPVPVAPRAGAPPVVELARPGGEARTVVLSAGAERVDATQRRLLAITDVTGLRRPERTAAEGFEEIGFVAAGVVHDFRNVLFVIEANVAAVAASFDPAVREAAEDLADAVRWGESLVRKLLAAVRQDRRPPERLDLASLVRGSVPFLTRLLERRHRLEVVADAPVPVPVLADPTDVEQVVMNLVLNARDAMPGGGRIGIRVVRLATPAAAALGSELTAGEQAMLEVEDDGVGMTSETRTRLFEPLFTTKSSGRGTGLGLFTVRQAVTRSGGMVAVVSVPGRGARFRVFLPIAPGTARDGAAGSP